MGLVSREITPEVIHRLAAQLGEGDENTRSALSASVPSALTTLSDMASSSSGAAQLARVVDESRRGSSSPAGMLSSPEGRDDASGLFEAEAGRRAAPIADTIARESGVRPQSAHKLLGGATGAALLAIAKVPGARNPAGLQAMLRGQRGEFVRRLPGPLATLFNGGRTAAVHDVAVERPGTERRAVETGPELPTRRGRPWLPLALLAALILIAIPLFRGARRNISTLPPGAVPTHRMGPAEKAPLTLPNGQTLAVPTTSAAYGLATFLAGDAPAPQRFTLTPLNFNFGTAQLTAGSPATVDDIAAVLNAYPSSTIMIESHTDNVGTPEANVELSLARSEAIKQLLVVRGVNATQLTASGLGQASPLASNDTAEGRAQNRRTEIVVTKR
jgi:outer membrane protein OmpA-like peptidoglycan-associated protein